jgi:hypothetical protein
MSTASRLYGIQVKCMTCNNEAKWVILNFPVCDACKKKKDR